MGKGLKSFADKTCRYLSKVKSAINNNVQLACTEQMARPGGNPDFGTKYRFNCDREKPLSAHVKVVMLPEIKEQLKALASEKQCTVPDLIQVAIEQYLAGEQVAQN